MNFGEIEPWSDDVIASSFENWPQELRFHALADPLEAVALSVADLRAILSQNGRYRRFLNVARPEILPEIVIGTQAKGDAFPKIGPVSWKECAAFANMPLETIADMMPMMLRGVTDRMAFILHAFVARQVPTKLHIFPFIDLGAAYEARFRIENGEPVHAKWINRTGRPGPPPGSGERLSLSAAKIASGTGICHGLLDLLLMQDGGQEQIKVVEVNPILEAGASGRLFMT